MDSQSHLANRLRRLGAGIVLLGSLSLTGCNDPESVEQPAAPVIAVDQPTVAADQPAYPHQDWMPYNPHDSSSHPSAASEVKR